MCGGGTPEPPPDYKDERKALRKQIESEYRDQADAWNSAVGEFNQTLLGKSNDGLFSGPQGFQTLVGKRHDGLLSGLQGFQRDHRNLGIEDISIESDSAKHRYDDLRGTLNDFQTSLDNLHAPSNRPVFEPVVGSEYGPIYITNIPTLNDPNLGAHGRAQDIFGRVDQNLSRLRDDRIAERQRIEDYGVDLRNTIDDQLSAARNFDLSQVHTLDGMERDRDQVRSRIRDFQSPIFEQVRPDGFAGPKSLLQDLNDQIALNIGKRDDEQSRIDEFGDWLTGRADWGRNYLRDTTIRDEDRLLEADRRVDRFLNRARDFDSELDFDFSDAIGRQGLGGVRSDIDDLMMQRDAELDRTGGMRREIENFNREVDVRVSDLRRQIDRLGLGDERQIGELEREIDSLMAQKRSEAGRDWSSDLYDNSLFDEYFRPPGDTSIRDTADALRGELDGVRQMHDDERDRISGFKSDLLSRADALQDDFSGLTIRDVDGMQDARDRLQDYQRRANRFDSELDFDFRDPLNAFSQIGTSLSRLEQDREAELSRTADMRRELEGFSENLGMTASDLSRRVGNLGLGDEHRIDGLESQIDRLVAERQSMANRDWSSDLYDNSLFDEYFRPPDSGPIRDTADALRGELDGVRQMHDDERDRISGFGSSLFDTASDLRSQIRGLGIADIDDIEGVRQAIENQMMDINRFESPLDFDFGRQMNEIMDVDNIASDLIRDREGELDRISRAEDNFSRTGRMLRDRTGDLGIHNRANLESARDALGDITSDIEGFESELDFDFSDVYDDLLPSIQSDLDELFAERRSALDGISESGNQAVSGLDDLALYDEDGMLGMRSDVFDAKRDLNRFSGGSVEDIRENLRGNIERIDGRLEELQEKRNQLAEQTEKLRTRLADKSFYTSEGLEPHEAELQAMRDEADLYNAQQAMSDLQHAEDRLGQERTRLEQDEQNTTDRRNQERQDVAAMIGPDGVPLFQGLGETDPYSMAAYQRFLNSGNPDDLAYLEGQSSSAFARNLGLGG